MGFFTSQFSFKKYVPFYISVVTEQERKAYRLALKHGLAKSATFRLLVFGPENSGKTCLIGTLFNEPFQENAATKGADVHICTIYAANWCKCSAKEMAEKLQIKFCKNLNIAAKKQVDPMSVARPSSDPSKPAASVNVQSSAKIPEVKIEEIKHAKAIKITSEEEFTAVVWDCAGQEKYITTHTFFVRRNNLVFIVFKASCNLFGPIEARRGDHQSSPKVTHFKVIHYWLQTVTSVRHETGGAAHMSEFLPTVVLVVTHIDEIIGGIEEAKDAIITQLAEELKGKPYAKHLIGNRDGKGLLEALKEFCIFLSNKSEFRDPETIARLKKIVQQASAPILEEKHPLVYIKIEKSLLSLQKEVITTTEFHEVAKDNGFLADKDSPEIMGALDHFHQMGIILHFPSIDELKELVFLSPQWLEKLFAYLIIAHPYKISGDNKDHLYECLVQDGILFGTFLKHMLQMFNKAQEVTGCNISFEQAVAFLAKFRFIAEISISTNFLEQSHPRLQCEENTEIFIVPSQLSEYKREVRSSFVQKTDVWSLHFIFSDGFVPSTIFYQVVAACITWNTKRSQPISRYVTFVVSLAVCYFCLHRLKCHEIMMVLDEGQYYGVSLCEESVSIQLDIILDKSIGIPSCEHRKQLIDFFESVLLQVCKELIPASPKPKMRIPCPFCHKPHVKYDAKPDELLCREQERMVPKKYYQNLLTYEGIY